MSGTIAFLEGDTAALREELETLRAQDNQMNLHVLEKLAKYSDRSYREAYSSPN